MPTINPIFVQKVHELTAYAYGANIECPVLTVLNNWVFAELAGESGTTAMPGTVNATFDEAVATAVQSSPNGIALADLQPILAQYKRPANQLGAALARLAKNGTIQKTGDLWHFVQAGATNINNTIDTRRAARGTVAA